MNDKNDKIQNYIDKVKPLVEEATMKQLFDTMDDLASNPELRKQAEETIRKSLPEGCDFYINEQGMGHLTT